MKDFTENANFSFETFFGRSIYEVDDIISNIEHHISRIQIPKRDGTKRQIIAPSEQLKYIQKSLMWKFFHRYKPHQAAHGFVRKRGIATNAKNHVGAQSLGKIDIEKFFDSISEDHLKNCLFGNKQICRNCKYYERMMGGGCHPSLYHNKLKDFDTICEEIKAVHIPEYCESTGFQSLFLRVIKLCTYHGFTAQGFPTSPVIANIVMKGFDKSMSEFCNDNDIVYSRYADDLAFSSQIHSKKELHDLTKQKAYRLLWAYGFKPNRKKTKYKSRAGRLRVCGVVVNEKLSIQKSSVLNFRAKVHHATVKFADRTTKSRLRKLKGWAAYLMSIDKPKGEKYMKQLVDFEHMKFST